MNRAEKERFIKDMMALMEADLLNRIKDMPEHWDGTELRWLIRDTAKTLEYTACSKKSDRYREYQKELFVRPL